MLIFFYILWKTSHSVFKWLKGVPFEHTKTFFSFRKMIFKIFLSIFMKNGFLAIQDIFSQK